MQKAFAALAVAASLLYAPASHAQFMSMFNSVNNMAVNFSSTVGLNAAIGQSAKIAAQKKGQKTTKKPSARTQAKRKAAYQPIPYGSDAKIRAAVVASYVKKLRRSNPNGADQLARVFQEQDLFGEFAQNARAYGLDTRDFGDVLTAFWAVKWGAVHQVGRPSRSQVQGLRRQFRSILAGSQLAQKTSLADRQKMADDMMVQLLIIDGAVQDGLRRKSVPDLRRVSRMVQQTTLTSMNINLAKLRLTSRGLQSR